MVGRAGYNDAERIWCRKEVCIDNIVERSLIAAFMRGGEVGVLPGVFELASSSSSEMHHADAGST